MSGDPGQIIGKETVVSYTVEKRTVCTRYLIQLSIFIIFSIKLHIRIWNLVLGSASESPAVGASTFHFDVLKICNSAAALYSINFSSSASLIAWLCFFYQVLLRTVI